ncbi:MULTISPECIES: hypothetical protein [unclassified Synechococcus]|uniref:hypothetical protein n=1 Tax=Synechococcales TaxID=1890424 RepID=UPI0021024653|nr:MULTISPECIES: hypothetical protein [unclassified Synechococcus]
MSTTQPLPAFVDAMPVGSSRLSLQDLHQALERRDGPLLVAQSLRWAHRHGVEALERQIGDQALDETARLWWREQLQRSFSFPVVSSAPPPPPTAAVPASDPLPAPEPVLELPTQQDAVPLPAEWLVPGDLQQQENAELIAASEPAVEAEVSSAPQEPITPVTESLPEATESLPPLAEAFGPISDLEPLPSFNVQAIFAMQSELAETPLAPPVVPPVMSPPKQLELEAFSPVEGSGDQTAALPEAVAPAEEAPVKAIGSKRNPFSRLRSLVKDCVEEVASSFSYDEHEEDSFEAPEPAVPPAADSPLGRAQDPVSTPVLQSPPQVAPFPVQSPASGSSSSIAPPPFALQQPLQPARAAQQRRRRGETGSPDGQGSPSANRRAAGAPPAPAPSHPALDSLRSWLPDSLEGDDHRQAS